MNMTGAELIIHLLERQGVRIVAGIPGGALLPLYEALGRARTLQHVLVRHEQAGGFIAQGMARITRKAGVCFATSGPGVTNAITAIADAKLDSIPLVCIAGQVPSHLIGTDAFQEVPTVDMVRPVTKASFFVRHARDLLRFVPEAFRIAETGRPGPVLIDVPKDVQLQTVQCSPADFQDPERSAASRGDDQSSLYDAAWELIANARRPVLYVGGGVIKAHAQHLLREFAEHTGIPVTTTLMALGALPRQHKLNLGMLGMHGARYTNLALDECDLAIAIGARFDDRATGRPDRFLRNACIVHIDIDRRELGKIKPPTLAIEADARAALRELLARVASSSSAVAPSRAQWLERIEELRGAWPLQTPNDDDLYSPYGIVRAIGELAPADAIVATDVGQHQMWVAQAFPFQRPDRWLTSGGLGTMGFGLPAAMGAALAEPAATTLCITGDGSLLMNIQELATLAELDLNVKIIVLDNASLGLVRQQQELFYAKRLVASLYAQPSNFVAIARAFGIPAVDLESAAAPYGALAKALDAQGPMLIRVPIAAEHHVLPMVTPGAANTEALDFTGPGELAAGNLAG